MREVIRVVAGIAANAKSASIYAAGKELSAILKVPFGAYNGILSMEKAQAPVGGTVITKFQRIEQLNRNTVSNQTSAVTNQVTGGVVGCILLFVALFIYFQDNTRDMLIQHMMGYRVKANCWSTFTGRLFGPSSSSPLHPVY